MRDRTTAASTSFELLARELEEQIAAGVLRPGDRLPSVRQACATRGVSPSTVFQAYDLLESRGLVRAVPRSGYFVAARADGALLAEPRRAAAARRGALRGSAAGAGETSGGALRRDHQRLPHAADGWRDTARARPGT